MLIPPIAFFVMLALAWAIAFAAKGFAAKGRTAGGKLRPYACGEEIGTRLIQPNYYGFFAVAFAYSVVHVSILTLAIIPSSAGARAGLIYLGLVLFSVTALVTELDLV